MGATLALLGAGVIAAVGASMVHVIDSSLGYALVPPAVSLLRFAWGAAAITMLIAAVVLRYLYINDGWQAQVRASARAEVEALQARIKPLFLFNSMNTIAGLVRSDPAVAERAVLDLSDLFRAALGANKGDSTLAEEVELAERYLAIEQLRLGDRLHVNWYRDEPLPWDFAMPRLVLQPLLENAVLHGISRLPEGGTVEIALSVEGHELLLRVRNPAPPPRERDGRGAQHAQANIGQRLRYHYGPRARMTARWEADYYLCELRVPLGGGARAG